MQHNLFIKITAVGISLLIVSFLLPVISIKNIDTILISATFLYGMFYGFQISLVLGNFLQLKNLLGTETGGLLAVLHLAKIIDGKFAQEVEKRIESYIMRAIDNPLTHYVQRTNKDFFAIFEPLETLEVKGEAKLAALNYLNEALYYLPQTRNQIAQVAPRDIDPPEWALLIILAGILIVALFFERQPDVISKISTAIFATTVISSLFLLDEVDSNRIQKTKLEYDIFNETLTAMGKLRYYPRFAIRRGILGRGTPKPYRVGVFSHFPSLTPREIKIIE
ncbi:MAG TPA: hypothetical protein VLF68_05235 [Candidatus Saccharimonadales bacterium]|nr:hypothetical protein [Candidatus Saccharimonadales bacterium]